MAEPSAPTLREFLEGKPKHGPLAMTAADWCLLYPTQAAAALDKAFRLLRRYTRTGFNAREAAARKREARDLLLAHDPKPKEKENG